MEEKNDRAQSDMGIKAFILGLIVTLISASCNKPQETPLLQGEAQADSLAEARWAKTHVPPGLGQALKTRYFEVTVNKVSTGNRVRTGNEVTDLKPEKGTKFLIINATFKNIDNESRLLTDGTVWVTYNGKDYKFDHAESIMANGWGLMLDQINPLMSIKTNLVYKMPTELTGPASFQPGRAGDNERIPLGNLPN